MSKQTASIADDPHALPGWLIALAGLFLLLLVAFVAYLPSLKPDVRFIWGDDDAVLYNPGLNSMAGLQKIWFGIFADPRTYLLPRYQPMASTLAWIEWRLFGLNPRGYHAVSMLMHALSGWVVWLILTKLAVRGALLAALAFVVHPMAVQSVAWQAEQGNVLSLLLGLSSLYVWLRYTGVIAGPPEGEGKLSLPADPHRMYAIGMILLVAALLSRPTAAVVPVALFAILWWKRGRIDLHREFLPLLPLLVVSAGIAALAGYMEVARAGATGAEWQFGSGSLASELTARVLMAGQAIWFYFGKLIWPFPTMFNYPQWDMTQSAMWAWIFPIATFVVLAGLVMSRDRIGRGPICAVIIFLAAVFPVLGFINVRAFRYAIVWDYFAHWALIPMLALIAAGAVQFWVRRRFNVGAGIAIAGIVLFFLTGFSYRQANAYANSGRLWDDTLRKNPTSTLALNELGRAALDRGDFQRARAMFERVLAVDPLNAGVRLNFGLLIEASGGRLDDAIAWYVDAVDLRQRFPQAWQRLGMAYQRLAMERRDAYRSLKPGWQQWWWGWSLRTRGDELLNAAIASYQNAIVSDANNLTAVMQLAALHAEFGRFDLAIPNYRRALELDEKNETARDQLAFALDMVGQHEEALGYWEELRLENPDNPRVLNSMGLALARRAQWEAAAVMFQNAVRADPRFVEGWHNLGLAQAEAGDLRTAITNFERALAINPQYAPSRRALDSAKTRLTTQPAE